MRSKLAQTVMSITTEARTDPTPAVCAAREFLLEVAERACRKGWMLTEQLITERDAVSKDLTRHFPSKNSRSSLPRQLLRRDRDVRTSMLLKGSDSTLLRFSTQGRYATCVGYHPRGVAPPV